MVPRHVATDGASRPGDRGAPRHVSELYVRRAERPPTEQPQYMHGRMAQAVARRKLTLAKIATRVKQPAFRCRQASAYVRSVVCFPATILGVV